ncbi:uncharacterized protein LOC134208777 [Armigeres subalbatus]|uniref:uncharacterized protein LOC134208777 n=1 Tax=Armigeres subalbatus TaxID=124917 RepID=UPI002ED492EB
METMQEAASPQDPSQPATDPLAIGDNPEQQESSSADMGPPPCMELESTKEATPVQPLETPRPQATDAQPPVAQSPPVESSSSEMVTVNTLDHVIKSPTNQEPSVDPLAPSEASTQIASEECQRAELNTTVEEPSNTSEFQPECSVQENISNVSSSDNAVHAQQEQISKQDASTNAQPTSSEKPMETATEASKLFSSPNEVASGSNSSSSTNNTNSFTAGSNSSSNIGSSLGIRNAVTSDNSLKINGISDLSILDVTQGNDDEIEVKVEGGSLMHKVIKFSLLNGMQDSSKRLENSRLIMSGVGSNPTIEKTLATTSSLGRTALGGGPFRQSDKAKEEGFKGGGSSPLDSSKTTPPACSSVRPESAESSSSPSSSNSNSCDSGTNVNNSDSFDSKTNRTEEPREQMGHSVDSNVSSGTNVENVRDENVSDTYSKSTSLDFREWPQTSTGSTVPAASSSTASTPMDSGAVVSTAASKDLSNTTKETDQSINSSDAVPPAKRPKAMYYADLPDFSKPMLSTSSLTSTNAATTTSGGDRFNTASTKGLSQLQMKTPDFSRIISPQSSTITNPPTSALTSPSQVSTTTARSHELQIANPDFSKGFASKPQPSMPTTSLATSSRVDERSSHLNPASFAEISKQRNYISDLQLKNPSFSESVALQQTVMKTPSSSIPPQGQSNLNSYRIEKPPAQTSKPYSPNMYRQETPAQVQLEEPKAHVIHKAASNSETSKPWNPALEYSPKQYNQLNEKDRYSNTYPTAPKAPPPLTGEPSGQSYPGYPIYPPNKGKEQAPPSVPVTHPGGIIVNNVKTYYPEQHQPLPKSKDLEFRLEHKEKQLRQEGTIITLKTSDNRPSTSSQPPAQNPHYPQQPYHASRSLSPATERRNETQEILYRDFKLKQSYEMPPQSSMRMPMPNRQQEEARARVSQEHTLHRDRSPYDPYYRPQAVHQNPPVAKYYPPPEHHKQSVSPASSATPSPTPIHAQNRSPVPIPCKPPQSGPSGMMHPPSNWPSQSRAIPSPHGSSTSSPSSAPPSVSPNQYIQQKNSPSPVHSYGPQPSQSQVYKSPSPSSSSSSSPYTGHTVPGPVTKYTQYYPCGNGERVVSIEINKETYKPGYKELDFNMEQKFAEVYQAHEMKEKQAKAATKPVDPHRSQPYPSASTDYAYRQAPYKPTDGRPQEVYRDEYGRSRSVSTTATHPQASRYPQQENASYGQYYQQRVGADMEMRKSEATQPYKPSSRDPSPAQRYGSSESLYHHSKQPEYHPTQASTSKAPPPPPHHSMYPPSANEPHGPPSQYGSVGKSLYPSSPYERPPENPSVISNTYSQDRASTTRPPYPDMRHHPSVDHYPPTGHAYQPAPPPAKTASTHPNPHLPNQAPPMPSSSRDNRGSTAWRYQQQQPLAPQPGPSGYNHDRPPQPPRDERQNPVIQQPVSKNIPVKVIATVNPTQAVPTSTTIAPATSTTKRESPLDLSVKTVKTKADSTGCDDYSQSSKNRDGLPKVNFNPNFKKHIPSMPERQPQDIRMPLPAQPSQPYHPHIAREPQPIPPHHPQMQTAGPSSKSSPAVPPHHDHRQMPVIGSAIPPGYDKKTDAYMSANYRAVGGPSEIPRDARYPPDNRYQTQPQQSRSIHPDHREQQAYKAPPSGASYPPRLPPGPPMPPHQYPNMPPKSEPYYPGSSKPPVSATSRSVYYPPHEMARSSKHSSGGPKLSLDDPRIEDRRFVESMLKKQASPSAEVIADLQAGKFSTRIPSALAPAKKRPAETIPKTSPPKAPRLDEPNLHRPYESNYRYPPHPGPAAPRDYYPVPIKHEPASPQPAGVYYSEKRSEMPSITRGVLHPPQNQPSTSMANHSVLQPNTQHNTHPINSHTSVITSYHAPVSRPEIPRPQEEGPSQREYHQQPPHGQLDERIYYPKPEPFRQGHGDPKYFGSSLDKTPSAIKNASEMMNNQYQQPPAGHVQSHIQYSGQKPQAPSSSQPQAIQHYNRSEVLQSPPRSDYFSSSNHAQSKSHSVIGAHQNRSYENLPPLISDGPKPNIDHRPTPPQLHSSQESQSQSSTAPSPLHRGADQSVISKLRTSLEQKERYNQLRKQNSSEMSEEDSKPPEMNSFPPSHFRSKGAMKAYTPIPNFDMPHSAPQSAQQPPPPLPLPPEQAEPSRPSSPIKPEPAESLKDPLELPTEIEGPSALDINDWGSACNEFVEQLQTGKKRGRRKRGIAGKFESDQLTTMTDEGFRADLPGVANSSLSEVPQEVLKNATLEIGERGSTSDEDKPLQLLKQQYSSTGELKEDQLQVLEKITKEKLSEKIARNMREKQRLEQEQKHEAKLGQCSSSEDESDTKRLVQRSKMRARKLRNRLSVPLKSSDVNTDGEDEEEEEQDQARDLRKRKRLVQTSSESEAGSSVKRMNRCQNQVKHENGTDLSSDEDESKCPGKRGTTTPEVKLESVKQGTQSDSESNDVKTKESVSGEKNCEAEDASSDNDSEKDKKEVKKGALKKAVKTRTTSKSRLLEEESSESEESVVEEETMTRSKSKLEMEKRRSNSKVLRNDKIVGNFVRERKKSENITPQKSKKVNLKLEASKKRILDSESDSKTTGVKKRTRQTSKLQTTSGSESSEESDVETVSERLRSRKQKSSETSAPSSASKRGTSQDNRTPAKGPADKKNVKLESSKRRGRHPKKTSQDCASANTSENFYPGWEKELYEFKRSIKVPPELITIGGKQYVHRISTSLPDLDSHHSDESETFSEIVKKINQKEGSSNKKLKTKAAAKQGQKSNMMTKEQQQEEKKLVGNKKFTSIIELLHERILRHAKQAKAKKSKNKDDKETLKPKQEFELLPTPGAESEALFNRKKKSLFDTAIFKSRTRTGQKVMQSKEIIREVFGGDDERPQSAPPLTCVQELRNITYDEMYNEMLTKSLNVAEFLRAQKKAEEERAVASGSGLSRPALKMKLEDLDDETQDSVLLKDSERITEEGDTPSVASERDLATPLSFKGSGKKKTHKSRRKGSSGFDYIRKKKKPVVNNGENSTPVVPKKKVVSVFENLESKDESHINKEIRSWVLNKGVGESVMHRAARLGYTDVIVYCLERLEMDPDTKDNAGYTPLHEACAKGHLDICHYLLQYGASHSEPAPSGMRPLHEAVENSFIEVVRLLLAFGADPMLATYAGQTPVQLAENNEMELFLKNHLYDIQSTNPNKMGWKLDGPWKTHDPEESGCDILADIPGFIDDDGFHNISSTTDRSTLNNSTNSTETLDGRHPPINLPPPPPPPPTPLALPPPQIQQPIPKKCDSNSNIMNFELKMEYKDCAVVLNDIHDQNEPKRNGNNNNDTTGSTYVNGQLQPMQIKTEANVEPVVLNGGDLREGLYMQESDPEDDDADDGEFVFEYEEADRPLPPLYLLKDESAGDKWVLMTDLCNFLKLKSKEAVMRQICTNAVPVNPSNQMTFGYPTGPAVGTMTAANAMNPNATTTATTNGTTNGSTTNRELIRELKLEDFLSRASCLQLLYAGEKLNINSNKVVLVKYNENVRNLLQVQTLVTKI